MSPHWLHVTSRKMVESCPKCRPEAVRAYWNQHTGAGVTVQAYHAARAQASSNNTGKHMASKTMRATGPTGTAVGSSATPAAAASGLAIHRKPVPVSSTNIPATPADSGVQLVASFTPRQQTQRIGGTAATATTATASTSTPAPITRKPVASSSRLPAPSPPATLQPASAAHSGVPLVAGFTPRQQTERIRGTAAAAARAPARAAAEGGVQLVASFTPRQRTERIGGTATATTASVPAPALALAPAVMPAPIARKPVARTIRYPAYIPPAARAPAATIHSGVPLLASPTLQEQQQQQQHQRTEGIRSTATAAARALATATETRVHRVVSLRERKYSMARATLAGRQRARVARAAEASVACTDSEYEGEEPWRAPSTDTLRLARSIYEKDRVQASERRNYREGWCAVYELAGESVPSIACTDPCYRGSGYESMPGGWVDDSDDNGDNGNGKDKADEERWVASLRRAPYLKDRLAAARKLGLGDAQVLRRTPSYPTLPRTPGRRAAAAASSSGSTQASAFDYAALPHRAPVPSIGISSVAAGKRRAVCQTSEGRRAAASSSGSTQASAFDYAALPHRAPVPSIGISSVAAGKRRAVCQTSEESRGSEEALESVRYYNRRGNPAGNTRAAAPAGRAQLFIESRSFLPLRR